MATMAKMKIGGLDVEVVDNAAAEKATFVVCGPVSHYPDDVHTTCALCSTPIAHRPHVPLMPAKICIDCMLKTARES
jgi:hypothetical protein